MRYLVTASLLQSWLYAIKEPMYETDRDSMQEFLSVLRREPTETTETMQKGVDFEANIYQATETPSEYDSPAITAAANIIKGGQFQVVASRKETINGIDFLLYGRLDALRAGVIYDIKFSSSYDKGKYYGSPQTAMYLKLVPEAYQFTYLIGVPAGNLLTETYNRSEVLDINGYISDFVDWLTAYDLLDEYKAHWAAKGD